MVQFLNGIGSCGLTWNAFLILGVGCIKPPSVFNAQRMYLLQPTAAKPRLLNQPVEFRRFLFHSLMSNKIAVITYCFKLTCGYNFLAATHKQWQSLLPDPLVTGNLDLWIGSMKVVVTGGGDGSIHTGDNHGSWGGSNCNSRSEASDCWNYKQVQRGIGQVWHSLGTSIQDTTVQ